MLAGSTSIGPCRPLTRVRDTRGGKNSSRKKQIDMWMACQVKVALASCPSLKHQSGVRRLKIVLCNRVQLRLVLEETARSTFMAGPVGNPQTGKGIEKIPLQVATLPLSQQAAVSVLTTSVRIGRCDVKDSYSFEDRTRGDA